jgi:hypothetical protein
MSATLNTIGVGWSWIVSHGRGSIERNVTWLGGLGGYSQ